MSRVKVRVMGIGAGNSSETVTQPAEVRKVTRVSYEFFMFN